MVGKRQARPAPAGVTRPVLAVLVVRLAPTRAAVAEPEQEPPQGAGA